MKKPRIIAALAAAFMLTAQSGAFMTCAEETAQSQKANIDEEIYASILKHNSSDDKSDDGIITEEEMQSLSYITLDGTIIKNLSSLKELNNYPKIEAILIKDWKDFDTALLKELQYVTMLELHNCTFGECSEEIDHIYNVTVYYSEELDLNRLKAFSNLQSLGVVNTKLTNVSALEAIDLKLLARDTTEDNSELLKYIKCSDIEMPEGFLYPVTVRPAGIMKGNLTVTDPDVVKLTDDTIRTFSNKSDEKYSNYIYAEKAGETEYQYSDKAGNEICTGKIRVIENKSADEPLDSENKRSVRIIPIQSQRRVHESSAYLLYDDGMMYTYNKEGRGELTFSDKNVSNLRIDAFDNNVVLYRDGTLKINGQNITENYKVVTASDDLSCILCSDGVLRRISSIRSDGEYVGFNILGKYNNADKTGDYSYLLEKVTENIKAMCPSNPYLVQTKDGKTALIYSEYNDGKTEYKLVELDLNIDPVSCVKVQYPVSIGTGWSNSSAKYYVTDNKNNLYMIDISETGSQEGKTKSFSSSLIASDVTGCGYLYRVGEGADQEADIAYTDNEGKAYSCTSEGKEIKAENGFELFNSVQFDYERKTTKYSFSEHTTASGTLVTDYFNTSGISLRTADGTENFTCLDRFASFTHVKESTGTFFDGSDYTILITREDNTLWKYSIESDTFTRIDNDLPAAKQSGPKYGAADLVTMMRYLCGIDDGTGSDWIDLNGDGKVNIIDFLLLKKEILRSFQ